MYNVYVLLKLLFIFKLIDVYKIGLQLFPIYGIDLKKKKFDSKPIK